MRRPADECPYPKPFPADFDDCPAYQPREFIPLDTMYQPLEPVLTCRHLETRALPQRHRWYAACALGNRDARSRWVRQIGGARLERIRAIQRQLGAATAPYTARLWDLKGQQLRAFRDGRDAGPATTELRGLAGEMTGELDRFLRERSLAFAEIGMPIEAARHLIHVRSTASSTPSTRPRSVSRCRMRCSSGSRSRCAISSGPGLRTYRSRTANSPRPCARARAAARETYPRSACPSCRQRGRRAGPRHGAPG